MRFGLLALHHWESIVRSKQLIVREV
jgi:hypothetical protein